MKDAMGEMERTRKEFLLLSSIICFPTSEELWMLITNFRSGAYPILLVFIPV